MTFAGGIAGVGEDNVCNSLFAVVSTVAEEGEESPYQ